MTPGPSWLPAAAAVLLAASALGPASRLMWHGLGDSAATARDLPSVPAAAEAPPTDLSALVAWAPFGAAPPPVETVAAAPQSSLDLVLSGVAISSDPARSAAFIAVDGQTRRFGVGESIDDGVTLTAVEPDFVRLDVEGETRLLAFPNTDLPQERAEAEVAEADTAPEVNPLERLRSAIVAAEPREAVEPPEPETIDDHIDLWRDRIRRNPAVVLDRIGLVPGERGYTIAEDHDSGVGMIGLRAGDLVTRVNGQPVGNVEQDRKLYDEIAAAGIARVEIERGGETITMSFPLR